MKEYHKIQTVFKRDPETKFKTLLEGEYSIPEFEYLARNSWQFTEKVDGTNIRIMYQNNTITYGGKTDHAQIPATLITRLNERFLSQIDRFASLFPDTDVCLYGEGYGAKIQSGGNYRPDQDFVLFDVRIGDWWLKRVDVEDIAVKLSLDIVPIIGTGTLHDLVNDVKIGFKSQWGDFEAEGIIAKPTTELMSRNGSRIITKLKCKDFR